MRHFPLLVIIAVAFGGAAVFYEQESRKVKGVLSQLTDLQAKVGDLQAEVNRLNSELESVKLADRRRPDLKTLASAGAPRQAAPARAPQSKPSVRSESASTERTRFSAGDVTPTRPAISDREASEEDREWSRPTVDAEAYRTERADDQGAAVDPYQ